MLLDKFLPLIGRGVDHGVNDVHFPLVKFEPLSNNHGSQKVVVFKIPYVPDATKATPIKLCCFIH